MLPESAGKPARVSGQEAATQTRSDVSAERRNLNDGTADGNGSKDGGVLPRRCYGGMGRVTLEPEE